VLFAHNLPFEVDFHGRGGDVLLPPGRQQSTTLSERTPKVDIGGGDPRRTK